MIHLLADYIFSDSLRYEGHKLLYAPAGSNPTELSGILAASIAAALLSVADEGEARGITLDTPKGRNDFFVRYEKEVLADNGGLLNTEVQALNEAYLEFSGEEVALGPNEIYLQNRRDYRKHPLSSAEQKQRGNWREACKAAQLILRDKSHPRYMELYHRWRAQLNQPNAYKQFPPFVRTVLLQEP